MRISVARSIPIDEGLERIRHELKVPGPFPAEVVAAAETASRCEPGTDHVDRTGLPFVTLDPAQSTDLDQAFCLETSGSDLVLRYAIADVGWFVQQGDPLDLEAWRRGTTMYLPDGRAPLYPPVLSERAASLLPDGPRPAVVFTVRLDADGDARLDGVERAVIRSRAKLAYETATLDELPAELPEFGRRMAAADLRRGAARVDPPEQEVERDDGGYRLTYRPRRAVEEHNAAMSLATNLAVGAALLQARTGMFRVMDEPDERHVRRLRYTAHAMGSTWPRMMPLAEFERTLDPTDASDGAIMLAIRRAGGGARYVPFTDGVVPWHAAMAATYSHATAPLRRLQDRHVVLAALAVANGTSVSEELASAFPLLPEVMQRADAMGNQIDRAVIDLVEAAVLQGREGTTYEAIVTDVDERGARIQLSALAVVARLNTDGLRPGESIRVKLLEASPTQRLVRFERVA